MSALPPATADDFDFEAALEACARGERYALRALYDREAARLLGVAARVLHDRQAAEDALQEAFVAIWQRASTFDRRLGSGRGWIHTIVRHAAIDVLRRRRPEWPAGDDLEAIAEAEAVRAAPHGDALASCDPAELERCLASLDEDKRRSIVLAFVDGWSHAEIATRTKTPVGTVKSWIRRGLLALRECLS